jgi:hypothetical protein
MKTFLIVVMALLLSACQSYSFGRYTTSTNNLETLRLLSPKSINVSGFSATTPNHTEILCVGRIYIKTQDGEEFTKFIEKALVSELKMAGVFSTNAKTTISGKLEYIDASYVSGSWEMTLKLTSSNGKSAVFKEKYSYPRGTFDSACMLPTQAFVPAVQDLISKILTSEEFKTLISET